MKGRLAVFFVLVITAVLSLPTPGVALTCGAEAFSLWIDFNSDETVQVEEYRCSPFRPEWDEAESVEDLPSVVGFSATHATVLRSYTVVLGREPELSGAQFWLSFVDRDDRDLGDVLTEMLASPEYEALQSNEDRSDAFVDALYSRTFDRLADQEGRTFWISALETGTHDRAGVAAEFAQSSEFLATNGIVPLWMRSQAPPNNDPDWLPDPL